MKKFVLTALALAGLLALATGLRADDRDLVAHIDHEFVAAGQTFPAGTYRFVPESTSQFLTIRSNGRASVFVIPMVFEGSAQGLEHVAFQRLGGVNYLSEVATPFGVYTLAVPRESTRLARGKAHGATSSAVEN